MTSEMVKRVARQMYEYDFCGNTAPKWPDMHEQARMPFLKRARAAIEAMREPTNHMGALGLIASQPNWPDDTRQALYKSLGEIGANDQLAGNPSKWMKPVWRAMIDAALSE